MRRVPRRAKKRREALKRVSVAPTTESVSIRRDLATAIDGFLGREGITGEIAKNVLIPAVSQLSQYSEEGQRLFPELFLFDDLESVLKSLPNSEHVSIGSGPQSAETLSLAIKRCAPLAQWGWSICVRRRDECFEYGLLRCGLNALSLSAGELLVEQGAEELPVVCVRHVSHRTIELVGARSNSLRINFDSVEESGGYPLDAARSFSESIVRTVNSDFREQSLNFYRRVLAGVLRAGHGCLAVTLASGRFPARLKDGVILSPPIDIVEKISLLLKESDCGSDTKLRAGAALIKGMLLSDGITVFGCNGSVRAYNVFIKTRVNSKGFVPTLGGARRRAFDVLSSMVGHDLRGAFFLSQDGHAEFRGLANEQQD